MNHCAVRGSANVNGATHHHIIVFGGQNLDQSRQYSDVAILTLPSFTWTQLGSLASGPSPRAGHTCELVGSQLVVVGGWLGSRLPCDSAPVSVFDTTTGTWTTSFQAGSTFTTPVMARNITGGTGQASKDTSATSSSPNQTTADSGAGTAGDEAETSGQDDEGGAVGGNGGSNNGNDAPTGGNGSIGGDGVVNTPGDGDQPGQGGRMHDSDDDSNSKVGPM